MKKEELNNKIFFIHTTKEIVSYIDMLNKKHFPSRQAFHSVDEGILEDIKNNKTDSAQKKIQVLISKANSFNINKIMVTCSATGDILDRLDKKLTKNISRIEIPSINELGKYHGRIGIVHTNFPVFERITNLMIKSGINKERLIPCFIEKAFSHLLNGKIKEHDLLIKKFLEKNKKNVDVYFLSQVSICSAEERTKKWKTNIPLVFMAEIGIINS